MVDIIHIQDDIIISCIRAKSFPEGVNEVHEMLDSILENNSKEERYAVSYPGKDGKIQYWAGANEALVSTDLTEGIEKLTIPAGSYLSVIIKDFMANSGAIERTFSKLITDPRIDPFGACVERYLPDGDMQCLVRLKG